jgi:hypothetical protein
MEPILPYLQRRLKESGAQSWPQLVKQINERLPADRALSVHSVRKLAYGDRANPGLLHVQALLDHFGSAHGAQPQQHQEAA